ncbi:sorting nexin-3-like [Planoprotostelium fungivorum]|uniref:Sorting nexin-3-like n=1 Tax=Planoprotostelium fungivorum TaxID=1890364 RepID=A0A2P6NBB9_9EUKA|nr:sorting nexin-3-like [Planoprotostelium fungivorum]
MIHNNLKSVHETEFNDGYSTPEYITVHVTDAKNIEMDGKKVYTTYKVSTSTTFPEYKQKEFAVRRRYKEFVWLRNHLRDRLNEKGKRLTLAELPGNTFSSFLGSGRFDDEFVETRRKGLEDFINSVVNHPFSRFEPALQNFLQDQDAVIGHKLYRQVFNVDNLSLNGEEEQKDLNLGSN